MPTASDPYEVYFLDMLVTALERVNGAAPYRHDMRGQVVEWNGVPIEAGDPPLITVADPSIEPQDDGGSLLGEDHVMTVPVVALAPSPGETQRDRVRGAMLLWQDIRHAIRRRVDGRWLSAVTDDGTVLTDLRLRDVVVQPEDDPRSSLWYSVVRVNVEMRYHVRYPTKEV